MSFRFPHVSDARAHNEDEWTLSRMASNSATSKPAVTQVAGTTVVSSPTGKSHESHTRRRLVFTDPVAFRYVVQLLPYEASAESKS